MKKRLTLFLMTRKGFEVLREIGRNYREVLDFVVIGRDRNVRNDYFEEIAELCRQLQIPFYERTDKFDVASDYSMAVSWRWILNLHKSRLIVFHDSILPKYRGFNPLVSYLINGENEIGVTALFASNEYDTGEIISQARSEIAYPIKIAEAIETISRQYGILAKEIAADILHAREISSAAQNESEATYSLWRDEQDYRIDWNRSANEIRRFIDAVGFPYSGASTLFDGEAARILQAEELEDVRIENRQPGKIIFIRDDFPIVVCGTGLIRIESLADDKTGESLLPVKKFRARFA